MPAVSCDISEERFLSLDPVLDSLLLSIYAEVDELTNGQGLLLCNLDVWNHHLLNLLISKLDNAIEKLMNFVHERKALVGDSYMSTYDRFDHIGTALTEIMYFRNIQETYRVSMRMCPTLLVNFPHHVFENMMKINDENAEPIREI